MNIKSSVYNCIKNKNKILGVKIKNHKAASNAIVSSFINNLRQHEDVTARIETKYGITVEESMWDITGEGNTQEEMQLVGKFSFSTNNFELPSLWVREGSKFMGKGPMDIKEALVAYMNLCQDCSNLAGLFDIGGLTWSETLEKAIDDKIICSTECDTCELWLPQVIQKFIIDPCAVGNYIEGIYRYGRRLFVNVLPESFDKFDVNSETEYLEKIQLSLYPYTEKVFRTSCHYDCNLTEEAFRKNVFDTGLKCLSDCSTSKIKYSDFTKIWPKYRKGPYLFTITDPDTGISTMQETPPVNDSVEVKDDLGLKTVIPQERRLEGIAEELAVLGHVDLSNMILSYTSGNVLLRKIDDFVKVVEEYKGMVKDIEKGQEKTIDKIGWYLDEVLQLIYRSVKYADVIRM